MWPPLWASISLSDFKFMSLPYLVPALPLNRVPKATSCPELKAIWWSLNVITAEVGSVAHLRFPMGDDTKLDDKGELSQWHHGTCVVRQG